MHLREFLLRNTAVDAWFFKNAESETDDEKMSRYNSYYKLF